MMRISTHNVGKVGTKNVTLHVPTCKYGSIVAPSTKQRDQTSIQDRFKGAHIYIPRSYIVFYMYVSWRVKNCQGPTDVTRQLLSNSTRHSDRSRLITLRRSDPLNSAFTFAAEQRAHKSNTTNFVIPYILSTTNHDRKAVPRPWGHCEGGWLRSQ